MEWVHGRRRLRRAGLVAVLALTATGVGVGPARAADTSATPIVQAFQAMFAASSFRITISSVNSYDKNDRSQSVGDMILVRQGKTFAIYMKLTTHQTMMGRPSTSVTEMISTATRTCLRMQRGTWNCHTATGSSFMGDITPDALRKASTQIKQVTPLGTRTVAGQPCRGYRFRDASEQTTQTTIWISVATQRPVQMQMGGAQTARGQSATSPSTNITETFSNWNDPSLKIPSV